MSKPTFATNLTSSCCCQRRCWSGCLTTSGLFISDVVDQLDMSEITARSSGNGVAGRRIIRG